MLTPVIRISFEERAGQPLLEVSGKLLDSSDKGFRIALGRPLAAGSPVHFTREAGFGQTKQESCRARVVWCSMDPAGGFTVGLEVQEPGQRKQESPQENSEPALPDYYDTLQLSPKADPDTIHRVYRMLAQRFHPDNPDSGCEETFKKLLEAYRVLSDPEQRAAYDVQHGKHKQLRWKIFNQADALDGRAAERHKRQGILMVLYARRINEPAQPAVTLHELEDLLCCPREHLEFGLWFLKEKGWAARSDNGRFTITVSGAEEAERAGTVAAAADRMLPSPADR